MSETTTEQLAEIDRDMADIDRQVAELEQEAAEADYKTQELETKTQELPDKTQELPEYTPPEGWRVLAVGEVLRDGDVIVHTDDATYATARVGGCVGANQRYIRPIEPQPQPEAQPVQVREGRWRTRNGLVKSVTAMPTDHEDFAAAYPWWDGVSTWREDGRWLAGGSTMDLVEYLGPIEPQPEPVQVREGRWRTRGGEVKHIRSCEPLKGAYYVWPWTDGFMTFQDNGLHQGSKESPNDLVEYLGPIEQQPEPVPEPHTEAIEELRSEVSYVQNLLGTERRRVTELEELVASLRNINEAQEKAFDAAGQDNTALRNQLAAVKAEVVQERLERNRWHNQVLRVTAELDEKTTQCEILQIELDAAQQVPADSPELRQLRADLAEVTQDRDTYRHAHELLLRDANTAHERTKAMTVEAIAEWLEPVRLVDHPNLSNETLQHLPQIMRHLTGLAQD